MEVLLMSYRDWNFAINMNFVSRVLNFKGEFPDPDKCLLAPGKYKMAVKLKNNKILPASVISKMITYVDEPVLPGSFLRGCLTEDKIESFVIYESKIYGVLTRRFLKMEE